MSLGGEDDRICEFCDQPAVVGFGRDVRWLCREHFELALAQVRETIEVMREALG